MKKFLFLLSIALVALQLTAGNVDRVTAQQKAQAFLKAHTKGMMTSTSPIQFVSERVVTNSSNVTVPVYYIFNTKERFIIVSGEDRSEEILALGDEPLDFNNIPTNMQAWLDMYQEQIEYLQAHPGLQVQRHSEVMAPSLRAQSVSQLLTARWDQTQPFWNDCVFNGTQCLTGCPATSLAQVFFYWKYPTGQTPSIASYTISGLGTIPALSPTTFDWANMRDYYGWSGTTGTTAQKAAVARLMRYIGQAEHMDYGPDGSGISSSRTDLISTACKTFGYDNNVRAIYKQNAWGQNLYNDTQWATMIQNELVAGHPIVYCALSSQSGHAFNVDGYDASANTYHINWGWSGSGNAYFALNAFTDPTGETFNQYQSMVIGIQPPGGQVTFPVISVEPESLDFGTTRVGQPVTRTFHVSGYNLLGDITFTCTGNSYYSVTPETLTAAQVMAGADITVTYNPLGSGTHTGNVRIEGGAAESVTIPCTGSVENIPTLIANPTELSFTGLVGETVTQTFTVTGYNMTGTTYLSVLNAGGVFSINKSNITKATIANGVEVTVSYKPKVAGVKTARVMMRSAGADTIYVELTGTATMQKFDPVMLEPNTDYITTYSFRADWTDETAATGVSSYTLEYYMNGYPHTVLTDIADKFYTVNGLNPGSTYYYKVKALYTDGTESAWSNIMNVTLLQGHAFAPGDVDHDNEISIGDVSLLIDYLLGNASAGVCPICADVDGDGEVAVSDVSALIDMLLSH